MSCKPHAVLGALIAVSLTVACSSSSNPVLTSCKSGCADGFVCVDGQCITSCAASGGTLCGALCVELLSDNANCGSCGVACPQGEACSGGLCAPTCAVGFTVCTSDAGSYCANLAADNNNCGDCFQSCPMGNACVSGTCQQATVSCQPGFTLCVRDDSQFCSDLKSDPLDCGGCNSACGPNALCVDGQCACPALSTNCAAPPSFNCTQLSLDPHNCGACGTACLACEACNGGVCAPGAVFGAPTSLALVGGLWGLQALDVNGDGRPDLAFVASNTDSTGTNTEAVEILYGDGTGGFPTNALFPLPAQTYAGSLAMGDLNGDGFPDAVMTGYQIDSSMGEEFVVAALFGLSDGGLGPYTTLLTLLDYPTSLALGDLDGDGLVDIALTLQNRGLALFLAQSDGGFNRVSYPKTFQSGYVTLGDINGDGRLDLVLGTNGATSVYLQLPPAEVTDAGPLQSVAQLLGIPAIIAGRHVYSLYNGLADYEIDPIDGGFSLSSTTSLRDISSLGIVPAVIWASGDLNGDGIVDLVVPQLSPQPAVVFESATGLHPASYPSSGMGYVSLAAIADFNGDGRPDVALGGTTISGSNQIGALSVLLNTCSQ